MEVLKCRRSDRTDFRPPARGCGCCGPVVVVVVGLITVRAVVGVQALVLFVFLGRVWRVTVVEVIARIVEIP